MNKFLKFNPFEHIEQFSLNESVVSCKEASAAKNIPLNNELKSLILKTSIGLYLLNIPGNKKANLRLVKKTINASEAYLADKETLEKLQVSAGTVTPLLKQIWELPQLLSSDVLLLKYISTNAGVHNKYIIFEPSLFLTHPNIIIGTFTKE